MIRSESSASLPPWQAGRRPRARRDQSQCLCGGSVAGPAAGPAVGSAATAGASALMALGRMAPGQHSSDLAAAGGSIAMKTKYGVGGEGVTLPHQRMEATCRVAPGGPAERATHPPAPDAGMCWPARQRGSRRRAENPAWQADRQQVPGQQDRSAAQTGRTHSCSVLRNGESGAQGSDGAGAPASGGRRIRHRGRRLPAA